MKSAHYNYTEWQLLNWNERALYVAHFRLSNYVRAHGDDAVGDYYERQAKRNKK